MNAPVAALTSRETRGLGLSGGWMLAAIIAAFLVGVGIIVFLGAVTGSPIGFIVGGVLALLALFFARGLFILQPNEGEVLVIFGKYCGTVREAGWYWTNPFADKRPLSLRIHNFNTPQLKVNDLDGNPIEIAAVVAWRVVDTARASFDVENYTQFIQIQAETALRHVASKYPYDITLHPDAASLRANADEVINDLKRELQDRLTLAGIDITDARLSHLAYAPEIAGAMLQRQQATAILAARRRIVEGAAGMVEDVIKTLERTGTLTGMTEAQRSDMVRSLLIVLTSDRGAQPIISAT
ncbi:MAG: SPFH domain-containing protein [Candidatus Thermoplasmatota archaeon]